ncbi:MAG: 2-hydroxyacyl-CoA dehydratase [Deltaproteobacteria bacterium]|nr:2-hydroxyacyl-CoA dehydratase [Deltaproteobacteria bacterium]
MLPVHHPRALWRAHGYLPVEVWGPPGTDATPAGAHLQPFLCSIPRCGLAFHLAGGLRDVDVVVVPHACDALQGLGSILTDLPPRPLPALTPYLPRATGEVAVAFLAAEIATLSTRLAEGSQRGPTADDLLAAALDEEAADAAFRALLDARPRISLSNAAFYEAVRSREYLPPAEFRAVAEVALAATGPVDGIPVLLSGIVPEPAGLLACLDRHGVRVVADDTACVGRRRYAPGTSTEPFRRMAEALGSGPPDTTRGSPLSERVAYVVALAAQTGARAALLAIPGSCDPELFALPVLRQALEAAGVRTLHLETDLSMPFTAQADTRVEALLESLP